MTSINYFFVFVVLIAFTACKKDDPKYEPREEPFANGLLTLSEGLFHQNNSTLSWIDLSTQTIEYDVFEEINGRKIGDTGNDMILYGGKIYMTVSTSSTVEILDKSTLKSVKHIPFDYNNKIQQPRYLAAHKGKVYVTSFDGYVTAIDTASLKVTKRVKVGRNPEGICVYDNALYVANSGGLDPDNVDSTVMKIDISTFTVTDTFVVGKNPGRLIADDYGTIYVVKRGDFFQNPSELIGINTANGAVNNLGISATSFAKRGDYLYLSFYNFTNGTSSVSIFNCASQSIEVDNFISNADIETLYGVFPYKEDQLICIDAMNFTNSGYLLFFNAQGQLTESINIGLNPNTIIHYQ
ncbi:MAG TPA: DUF5074 domain-containing protein [Brumimicrobium sp.]|nr:DUF5074 domain-containing protein [Brumimicrobium sp.]